MSVLLDYECRVSGDKDENGPCDEGDGIVHTIPPPTPCRCSGPSLARRWYHHLNRPALGGPWPVGGGPIHQHVRPRRSRSGFAWVRSKQRSHDRRRRHGQQRCLGEIKVSTQITKDTNCFAHIQTK